MKLNFRKAMLCLTFMASTPFATMASCECSRGQGINYVRHSFNEPCSQIAGKYATGITISFNSDGVLEKQTSVLTVADALGDLAGSNCVTR